jgi:hypothetical protein
MPENSDAGLVAVDKGVDGSHCLKRIKISGNILR